MKNYIKKFYYSFITLIVIPSFSMDNHSSHQKYQTKDDKTYTIGIFKELIELKKRHAAAVIDLLTQVDLERIDAERKQYGEIEESYRYQLLNPQFREGGAYKPVFNFVVLPYFGPMVAVDIVALKHDNDALKAAVLRKLKGPQDNRIKGYATIGGITEFGQTFKECAIREALEEANIQVDPNIILLNEYSDPLRDDRFITQVTFGETTHSLQRHIASIAFAGRTNDVPKKSDNTEGIIDVELLTLEEIEKIPQNLWLNKEMPDMYKRAFARAPEIMGKKIIS